MPALGSDRCAGDGGRGGLAVTIGLTRRSIAVSMSPCCTCVPTCLCQNTYHHCISQVLHTTHMYYTFKLIYKHALSCVSPAITLMCVCVYTRQDTAERMAMRSVIEAKSTSTSSPASRPNLSAVSCFPTQKPNTVRECTQTDTHSHVNTLHIYIYIYTLSLCVSLSVCQSVSSS